MRQAFARVPRPLAAGILVFLMAFGLFAATTAPLSGYEDETAAVTEALVLRGQFYEIESAAPRSQGIIGEGGHFYARTGLLQPLLEAPFYAAGHLVDRAFGPTNSTPYARLFLWFFNPFVAALGAVALFALVFLTRRSLAWAIAIAGLFTVASIAWPYAKIGMDTTFMFAIMAAFALAVWARREKTPLSWGLTGFAAGAAAATKSYAVLALIPLAVLLLPTFLALDRRRQLRLGIAVAVPVLLWGLAIAWYNVLRFGGPTDFGYSEFAFTLSMPLNVIGLLVSPGKGLFLYMPIAILGAHGLPRLWRADRALTAAMLSLLAILTCISGASDYWGDEVWGPRYIVPAAWVLLVPIAWWVDTLRRRRVLIAVTAVSIAIQIVAVSIQYSYYMPVVQRLSGVEVYGQRFGIDPQTIPYGDDPPRWIPELSPLILQTEVLLSRQVVEPLTGDGITVTYSPYEGRVEKLDLSDPEVRPPLDFWWFGAGFGHQAVAALAFLVSLASGFALYLMAKGRRLFPARTAGG